MLKNSIIVVLLLLVVVLGGYLLWNNNKGEQIQPQQQSQISKVTDEKVQLQKNVDDAVVRLDSVSGQNNKLRQQIRGLLSKQHITESERSIPEKMAVKEQIDHELGRVIVHNEPIFGRIEEIPQNILLSGD